MESDCLSFAIISEASIIRFVTGVVDTYYTTEIYTSHSSIDWFKYGPHKEYIYF